MFSSGYKESQWRPVEDKLQEIFLPGIGAEALGQVLEFVYTGSLELSPANIQSVLLSTFPQVLVLPFESITRAWQSVKVSQFELDFAFLAPGC